MSERSRIEPAEVVNLVEEYVESELNDARRYENRTPLDDSGIFALHLLAATIYALAWTHAERAVAERERRAYRRLREGTDDAPEVSP